MGLPFLELTQTDFVLLDDLPDFVDELPINLVFRLQDHLFLPVSLLLKLQHVGVVSRVNAAALQLNLVEELSERLKVVLFILVVEIVLLREIPHGSCQSDGSDADRCELCDFRGVNHCSLLSITNLNGDLLYQNFITHPFIKTTGFWGFGVLGF